MKKLAILAAIMLLQTQVMAAPANTASANYNKRPAQRTQQQQVQQQVRQQQQQTIQQQPRSSSDNTYSADYLLKYNIDDLEAAPWLNGGKRKI